MADEGPAFQPEVEKMIGRPTGGGWERSVFDSLPEEIAIIARSGVILAVNEAWRRFASTSGTNPESVGPGTNYLEICGNTSGQDAAVAQEVSEGIRKVLDAETPLYQREYPCHGPEREAWFQLRVAPLSAGDGVRGAVISHAEITEQKRAMDRLSQQAALLDKATDAIVVRTLDHRVTFWNSSAERLYGWSSDEAIGESVRDLVFGSSAEFDAAVGQLMAEGHWSGELPARDRQSRELIVDVRWTLVRNEDGEPDSVLATNTDITSRKKLEQQFLRAQRMESLGRLAGGIAHDLNNVLAPIVMGLDLLKSSEADSDKIELIEMMKANSERGSEMIKQVLGFARGVEGKRVEVEVLQALEDVRGILVETFPKNISVSVDVSEQLWSISADPTQLHQVLMNTSINARDAMPDGGILRFSAANLMIDEHFSAQDPEASPGPYVRIQIEDTGDGMTQEVLDQIFEPFFTTKAFGQGTGLGMSTSLAIVRSHGGFIRVYSEPGRGTTLRVYLPVGDAAASYGTESSAEAIRLLRGNGETILVVDDEPSIRHTTRLTLEAFGYRALEAHDGPDAVATYARSMSTIAVVLMDMMMPAMDGRQTAQVILRLNPHAKIIATSGMETNAGIAGITQFLAKPFTAETLLTAISASLAESRDGT